jgi:hypothetical protein
VGSGACTIGCLQEDQRTAHKSRIFYETAILSVKKQKYTTHIAIIGDSVLSFCRWASGVTHQSEPAPWGVAAGRRNSPPDTGCPLDTPRALPTVTGTGKISAHGRWHHSLMETGG